MILFPGWCHCSSCIISSSFCASLFLTSHDPGPLLPFACPLAGFSIPADTLHAAARIWCPDGWFTLWCSSSLLWYFWILIALQPSTSDCFHFFPCLRLVCWMLLPPQQLLWVVFCDPAVLESMYNAKLVCSWCFLELAHLEPFLGWFSENGCGSLLVYNDSCHWSMVMSITNVPTHPLYQFDFSSTLQICVSLQLEVQ